VPDRSLSHYEPVVGPSILSQLRHLAEPLKGASVVHVNSTREGGGVAEILHWLVPFLGELGVECSWEVLDGDADFFAVTKAFHNGLQGEPTELTREMIAAYEDTVARNAERLRPILEAADYVVIHDPQPAALLGLCPDRRGRWIWRCHIDASSPHPDVWNYLQGKIEGYDASIFSMPEFAQPLPHPQFLIAPSIDPLSDKNRDLEPSEILQTLVELELPSDLPLLTQVSRFDRFKDPLGVIEAFRLLGPSRRAGLVLVGGGASDDPEGMQVFEEVREAAEPDPCIWTLMLPADAHRTINALQRSSAVVLQKSLREGFALTVSEGLWKSRPVIGGNVGGIRLQLRNGFNGYLVDSPEGAALRLGYLLGHPERADRMGRRGREYVRDCFLLSRHLRDYLTLFRSLQSGGRRVLIA
jgi:trehalose synthase